MTEMARYDEEAELPAQKPRQSITLYPSTRPPEGLNRLASVLAAVAVRLATEVQQGVESTQVHEHK
jgi:hypothetical protein